MRDSLTSVPARRTRRRGMSIARSPIGHHRQRSLALEAAAAQHGADPGQQLVDPERLGDVVVGAEIEGCHLLGLGGAHRQHDDRQLRPFADPRDHLLAVEIRQAEVEDHEIGALGRGPGDGFLAARGLDHLVAVRAQADPQELADLGLVVDHQDAGEAIGAHGRVAPPSAAASR